MGDTETEVADFKDYLSTHYGNLNDLSPSGDRAVIDLYARTWNSVLPEGRRGRCVDLGCGTGRFVQYLSEAGFEDVVGIDASQENCLAGQAAGRPVIHAESEEYLARSIDAGHSIALLSLIDVIEHIPKERIVPLLSLCRRALAEDGRILIKTVNAASPVGAYSRYMDITHTVSFSPESLRQVTAMAGFGLTRLHQVPPDGWRARARCAFQQVAAQVLYRGLFGRKAPESIEVDLLAVAFP